MQNLGIDILANPMIWQRLFLGLLMNLEVAFVTLIFTIIFGFILGIIRVNANKGIRLILKLYLDIVRVVPTLILLYVLYYLIPQIFEFHINNVLTGIIAFSFWGIAEMSDIVRQAIISIPKHQYESATAIGLNKLQLYKHVILPQSLKNIIPASLNLFARIIMTTSLLVLVGIKEIIKVGKEIIEFNAFTNRNAPFWIYAVILLIFFVICYSLSKSANKLEQK